MFVDQKPLDERNNMPRIKTTPSSHCPHQTCLRDYEPQDLIDLANSYAEKYNLGVGIFNKAVFDEDFDGWQITGDAGNALFLGGSNQYPFIIREDCCNEWLGNISTITLENEYQRDNFMDVYDKCVRTIDEILDCCINKNSDSCC